MNERIVFDAALEIQDPQARRAFIETECAGNPALLAAVEALLKSHDEAGSFLKVPAVEGRSPDSAGDRDSVEADKSSDVVEKTCRAPADEPVDDDSDDGPQPDLSFLKPSSKPDSIGLLGHYDVLRVLGQGGFGFVLKAFDQSLHRLVAIKVMNQQMAVASPPRKRFLREARAAAAIRHENVVQVYSVEEQPLPFLVMEFIDGPTLKDKLTTSGPLETPEVLHLGRQIASGLAAAQAMGLIHRDIKPGNILLEQGAEQKVKISDFGLARAVDDASLTRSGTISGTPMFMAPEQALGQPLDHRADLFSLGSVLYQMACGRAPFRAPTTMGVLRRVIEDTPRPLQEIIPEIPDWLAAIVTKLHAKKPEDRFQSAKEVADLLARCQSELQLTGKVTCVPVAESLRDSITTPPDGERDIPSPPAAFSANIANDAKSTVDNVHRESPESASKVDRSLRDQNTSSHGVTRLLSRNATLFAAAAIGIAIVIGLQTNPFGRSTKPTDPLTSPEPAVVTSQPSLVGWHGWPSDAPPPAIAPFDAEQAKQHQEAWAKYLSVPVEYTNSLGMKFRLIPPGEFLMGSTNEEVEEVLRVIEPYKNAKPPKSHWGDPHWEKMVRSEFPQHRVVLTQPFYLGQHEVTRKDYESFSEKTASTSSTDAVADLVTAMHPAVGMSWEDAAEFCSKLSAKEQIKPFYFRAGDLVTFLDGQGYRLPTEAEWEFACRAGTTTKYWSGDEDEDLHQVGWSANSGGRLHAVGELKPSPFGLYDIHGNAWEWCQDWWDPETYAQFGDRPAINPTGPKRPATPETSHVSKGGDWFFSDALPCRSALRMDWGPRHHWFGFRAVLSVDAVRQALKINGSKSPTLTREKPTSDKSNGWHGWPSDAPPPAIAPFDAEQAKQHQEAWAKYLGVPVEYTNSLSMKFRLIPPGEFTMGSTPEEIEAFLKQLSPDHTDWRDCVKSEAPQHKVILTQPIYLGIYELTQGEYEKVLGENPSKFAATGPDKVKVALVAGMDTTRHPVENVHWDNAVEFCAKLCENEKLRPFTFGLQSGKTVTIDGNGYRLPTEAEWEFACRAGTTTKYWTGDKDEDLVRAGWFGLNSELRTHAVGELKANPFGLHDTHGNVWEWVQDGWEPNYYGEFAQKPAVDPLSPFFAGSRRLFRGGNFFYPAHCRSSARNAGDPLGHLESLGFRVALSVDGVRQALKVDGPRNQAWDYYSWAKTIASRSADGQVVEVVKKLRELNPEFDGNFSHKVEKGAVTELTLLNTHIFDISPIRALPELKTLGLAGSTSPNQIGQLVDLSPLAGMKLTSLDCSFTRVKDLSPLKGMKLTKLHCHNTEVDDLSPLAEMPLTELDCGYTGISDLSPLKGMPLTKLAMYSTHNITDLSALKGLPLTELVFFHNIRVTDLTPLKGMKLTVLDFQTTGVTDLSPLLGMPLTSLQCANTKVSDLSPLEGMPLRRLICNRTLVNDAALRHLSELTELETLDLVETKVSAAGVTSLRQALPNCKIVVES